MRKNNCGKEHQDGQGQPSMDEFPGGFKERLSRM